MGMKTRAAALLVVAGCVLNSCALIGQYVDAPRVTAEVAVQQFAAGGVKLLDVRAAHERLGREISQSIYIQFGANRWDNRLSELEAESFLLALAHVVNKTDEVFVICNQEVRSAAAVRLMRAHGYRSASTIAGGYMGTRGQPGWQFFE
jgi:rhodanese-related sulfurtransferase